MLITVVLNRFFCTKNLNNIQINPTWGFFVQNADLAYSK